MTAHRHKTYVAAATHAQHLRARGLKVTSPRKVSNSTTNGYHYVIYSYQE